MPNNNMLYTHANIYTLTNPLNGLVYYVGCTVLPLEQRVKSGYYNETTKMLRGKKMQPIIELIERVPVQGADKAEGYWIAQMKAWGFLMENKILNPCNGIRLAHPGNWKYKAHLRLVERHDKIKPFMTEDDTDKCIIKYGYLGWTKIKNIAAGKFSSYGRHTEIILSYFERVVKNRNKNAAA